MKANEFHHANYQAHELLRQLDELESSFNELSNFVTEETCTCDSLAFNYLINGETDVQEGFRSLQDSLDWYRRCIINAFDTL